MTKSNNSRPVRFHLALLRMRENKGLRRIAALANVVGLTHLAQGGAQLVVKLVSLGRVHPSRPCTRENASRVLYTWLTAFIDNSLEGLSDTTLLVSKLGTNAKAIRYHISQSRKYWKAFEIEFEA